MVRCVTRDRDIAAFGRRAHSYDEGWLGRFHHEVAQSVALIAGSAAPHPHRVLDVGCGTGYLLDLLAKRYPAAQALVGVDASAAMVAVARAGASDGRVEFREGSAERLPFEGGEFDLVVSTTSFDHWHDQAAGLRECARVLDRDGAVVIADLFSVLLLPTVVGVRRTKTRTRPRAERLITHAGLRLDRWHRVQPLVQAFVARPDPTA
jgi:ubiquinone/menaquinone biosynthesis C-methylase UbiE